MRQDFIAIESWVGQQLSETQVVGVLHHAHLVQSQRLLQRLQEVLDRFPHLNRHSLHTHLLSYVHKQEILYYLRLQEIKIFFPSFLNSTKHNSNLSNHASDSTYTRLALDMESSDFEHVLPEYVLSVLALLHEAHVDLFLEFAQLVGLLLRLLRRLPSPLLFLFLPRSPFLLLTQLLLPLTLRPDRPLVLLL